MRGSQIAGLEDSSIKSHMAAWILLLSITAQEVKKSETGLDCTVQTNI